MPDKKTKKIEIKNAFIIGAISSLVYLACYFARNILSVVTPQIVADTKISFEFIGTISTANMFFYAGGQLINGIIGDKIKAKYLVGGGLVLAGLCSVVMGLSQEPSLEFTHSSISKSPLATDIVLSDGTRMIHSHPGTLIYSLAILLSTRNTGTLLNSDSVSYSSSKALGSYPFLVF